MTPVKRHVRRRGVARNTPAATLDSLDDPTLQQIAQLVGGQQRRCGLPLISRRWGRLLRGRSPAWETLVVGVDAELPADGQTDEGAVVAWFQQRTGAVQHLILRGIFHREPRLSAALTVGIVMTQCNSLRSLRIDVPACGVSGSNLGVLAACTQLSSLHVNVWCRSYWSDKSVGLFKSIRHMPALQNLVLQAWGCRSALPGPGDFTALRSATLTRLCAAGDSGAGGTLHLEGLPALRDLELVFSGGHHMPDYTTATSFTAVSSLTRLHLRQYSNTAQLHPDSLHPLSALQDLTLQNCGLTEFPAALAAVGRTLRSLDISQNRQLQLTAKGNDILLGMPQLRTLTMKKRPGSTAETASTWTNESMQFAISLARAHAARYPQRPLLEIVCSM